MSISNSIRRTAAHSVFLVGIALTGGAFAGDLKMPAWQDIFNSDGTIKDLQAGEGGVDAVFMADRLSLGLGVDSSSFSDGGTLTKSSIGNEPVSLPDDIGNAYLYSRVSQNGTSEFYVGVERLALHGHLIIEFNQQSISVTQGQPWLFSGTRSDGDLAIGLWVNDEARLDAALLRWHDGAYQALSQTSAGSGCVGNGNSYMVCAGDLKFISDYEETLDSEGAPLGTKAEQLIEVGLNVGGAGGSGREYRSVLIHSAEDIVMGQFSRQGFASVD